MAIFDIYINYMDCNQAAGNEMLIFALVYTVGKLSSNQN